MAGLTLYEKLDQIEHRYVEMTAQLSSPEIWAIRRVTRSSRAGTRSFPRWSRNIASGSRSIRASPKRSRWSLEADDAEMKQMAEDEERQLAERKETVERELKVLLLPKDPNDEKNVIVEIRAGTGGDEAALFAGELFRMYSRYAESQKWKVEVLESSPSSLGGMKQVVASIQGKKFTRN